MWKWIVGAALVVVLALAGTCYSGYRRLTASGDSVTVTIRGDANHVFAALANPDSMLAWLTPGSEVTPIGKGAFHAGDTVRISSPAGRDSTRRQTQVLVVKEMHAPTSLVVDAIQFNPSGMPHVVYTRRDSIVAIGDSTRVISSFAMAANPLGVPGQTPNSGGAQGAMVSVAEKVMVGAARMMTDMQRKQLKSHIEQP